MCNARLMIGNCAAYVYCQSTSDHPHKHVGILENQTHRLVDDRKIVIPNTGKTVEKVQVSWSA